MELDGKRSARHGRRPRPRAGDRHAVRGARRPRGTGRPRRRDASKSAAADIGGEAIGLRCDVTKPAEVQQAIADAVEAFGGLDVMINNAGIEIGKPIPETSDEEFAALMAVNVDGVFYGIKYAIPALAQTRRAASSTCRRSPGLDGVPLLGAYCASKAAVIRLTQTAAIELREAGIRVNAICPSFIQTEMVDRLVAPFEAATGANFEDLAAQAQGRLGTPEEVAEMAASSPPTRPASSRLLLHPRQRPDCERAMSGLLGQQGGDRHRRRQGPRASIGRGFSAAGATVVLADLDADGLTACRRRAGDAPRGLRRARGGAGAGAGRGHRQPARPRRRDGLRAPGSPRSTRSCRCRWRSGAHVMSVDLDGVFLCTKHAGLAMARKRRRVDHQHRLDQGFRRRAGDRPLRRRQGRSGVADQDGRARAATPAGCGSTRSARAGSPPTWSTIARPSSSRCWGSPSTSTSATSRAGSASPTRSPGWRCSSPPSARGSPRARPMSSTAAPPPRWSEMDVPCGSAEPEDACRTCCASAPRPSPTARSSASATRSYHLWRVRRPH